MEMIGGGKHSMHATRQIFDAKTAKEKPITMTEATLMMLQDHNGKNQNIAKIIVAMAVMKIMVNLEEWATMEAKTLKQWL